MVKDYVIIMKYQQQDIIQIKRIQKIVIYNLKINGDNHLEKMDILDLDYIMKQF